MKKYLVLALYLSTIATPALASDERTAFDLIGSLLKQPAGLTAEEEDCAQALLTALESIHSPQVGSQSSNPRTAHLVEAIYDNPTIIKRLRGLNSRAYNSGVEAGRTMSSTAQEKQALQIREQQLQILHSVLQEKDREISNAIVQKNQAKADAQIVKDLLDKQYGITEQELAISKRLQSRNKELTTQIDELRDQAQKSKISASKKQKELVAMTEQNDQVKAALNIQTALAQENATAHQEEQKKCALLQAHNQDLARQLEEALAQVRYLTEQNKESQTTLKITDRENQTLKDENLKLQEELDQIYASDRQRLLEDTQAELAILKQQAERNEREVKSLTAQLEKAQADAQYKTARSKEVVEENKKLHARLDTAKNELERILAELERVKSEKERFEKDSTEYEETVSQQHQVVQALIQQRLQDIGAQPRSKLPGQNKKKTNKKSNK